MKIYEKYNYGFFGWLLIEVFGPSGVMITLIMALYLMFRDLRFNVGLFIVIPVAYCFWCGYYQHSIRAITTGIWSTILTPVGIYGKRFWEKVLFFLPYRLLARWEDIERVEYHKESFDPDLGYIRVLKKEKKKFDIIFMRVLPYRVSHYLGHYIPRYQPEGYPEGSCKGMVIELAGIIAWKVGAAKMFNFPEREVPTSSGMRKYILAMDTILSVVSEIKKGSSFIKIDKEYEKSEEKASIKRKIYLWELDAMENPYR
jgi:hypothetical protein